MFQCVYLNLRQCCVGFCVRKGGNKTGTDGKPKSLCVRSSRVCDRLLDGAAPDGVGVATGRPSPGALLLGVAAAAAHVPCGDRRRETGRLPESAPAAAANPPRHHARRRSLL